MNYDFETKPDQVILYMDLLGFRNAIRENDDGTKKYNVITTNFPSLAKIICEMFCEEQDNVKFLWVSDSFMLSTDISHINDLLWYMFDIQKDMLLTALPVRGAICIGNLYHEKNIWGEALVRAVEIEETKSIYPRILIHNDDFARLPISEEYALYFKSDFEIPDYKYIEPISYNFDQCMANAFTNSNGIWALLNVLISVIEEQYERNCSNTSVKEKWQWLANVCISVFENDKDLICQALEIDKAANAQPQSFEECIARLRAILK